MSPVFEVNFDGLVGPTHNYAGLSSGNVASMANKAEVSNPKEAALQGLAKMKFLADLGLTQAVIPPQERPAIAVLKRLDFSGSDSAILEKAQRQAPEVLAACASASSMWVANAVTVAPSLDTADKKVHLTPANLVSKFHRSLEPPATARIFKAIFHTPSLFVHHPPLPGGSALGDEGAANHTRFCPTHDKPGLHFFVYGQSTLKSSLPHPSRFPARQSLEASTAVARLHQLSDEYVLLAQQNPAAIDVGVFHNDVISVGNRNVFLYHEQAFVDMGAVIAALQNRYRHLYEEELHCLKVPAREVSLDTAVASYLFNSQIVTLSEGRMALIVPVECRAHPTVHAFTNRLLEEKKTPFCAMHTFNLRQSMRNGGGPACLRLRGVLTEEEFAQLPPRVILTEITYSKLVAWVQRHYRETLRQKDLSDPQLLCESRTALDELTQILGLGSIYPFQSEDLV